jgi:dCTP deaminase
MNNDIGGILTGPEIKRLYEAGDIKITPWNEDQVNDDRINPSSYDLTLGEYVAVYADVVHHRQHIDSDKIEDGSGISPNHYGYLDVKCEPKVHTFKIDPKLGWILKPGVGYLMHTQEVITTDNYVPILDGKSSIGRLFITAHITAGFGDYGFDGQYTLEVVVTHPIRVYPGMRFCQMRFHTLVGEKLNYRKTGHYQGQLAQGPVPSRIWKSFANGRP